MSESEFLNQTSKFRSSNLSTSSALKSASCHKRWQIDYLYTEAKSYGIIFGFCIVLFPTVNSSGIPGDSNQNHSWFVLPWIFSAVLCRWPLLSFHHWVIDWSPPFLFSVLKRTELSSSNSQCTFSFL